MLLLVARGGMEFSKLQKALEMTSGNLWSHVEKLKRYGYVKTTYKFTRSGPRLIVEPTDKGVEETIAYVEKLRRLLASASEE
jgi:DNA-binding MarR family transcriptional regulator